MGKRIKIRKCRSCGKVYRTPGPWAGCCSHECLSLRRGVLGKKKEKSASFDPSSERWLVLRYKVLTAYGRKCQCCGALPPWAILQVDHIKPRSKFPELTWDFDNLQVLCRDCNKGKRDTSFEDFRENSDVDFLSDTMKNFKP